MPRSSASCWVRPSPTSSAGWPGAWPTGVSSTPSSCSATRLPARSSPPRSSRPPACCSGLVVGLPILLLARSGFTLLLMAVVSWVLAIPGVAAGIGQGAPDHRRRRAHPHPGPADRLPPRATPCWWTARPSWTATYGAGTERPAPRRPGHPPVRPRPPAVGGRGTRPGQLPPGPAGTGGRSRPSARWTYPCTWPGTRSPRSTIWSSSCSPWPAGSGSGSGPARARWSTRRRAGMCPWSTCAMWPTGSAPSICPASG